MTICQVRAESKKSFCVWNYHDKDPNSDRWIPCKSAFDAEMARKDGKRRIDSVKSEAGRKLRTHRAFELVRGRSGV